jgi:hypothetical protein
MKQIFENINVQVKLNRNEFETFKVYEGGNDGLYCFDWDNESCYDYNDNEDDDYDGVHHFTISKDTESRYGKHYKPNIRTVEEARMVIEKFNNDFGLDWGMERFRLECSSVIEL